MNIRQLPQAFSPASVGFTGGDVFWRVAVGFFSFALGSFVIFLARRVLDYDALFRMRLVLLLIPLGVWIVSSQLLVRSLPLEQARFVWRWQVVAMVLVFAVLLGAGKLFMGGR